MNVFHLVMRKGLSSVGLSFSSASWGCHTHEAELKLSPTDDVLRNYRG